MGAVILGETRRDRTFHPLEVERAVAICNQLATAISSARLYDDLKKSYTKLSHAQEELVKRERLAAVGELAALVAHEVRNPLAVIFNSLHSLKKSLQPQGEVQTLLNIVNEEANRLNSMVGDFLDFARPNEPNPQLGSLGELVEGALEAATSAAQPTGIDIRVEISQTLPKLAFDARLLRQAIINLAVNGIQAMPKGGVLTLKTKEELYNERRWAVLEVSDTGAGIPPSVQKNLFQPFFTTKATGTGLGLAVVKRIVEAHRGEISFESEPGQATLFRVRLPLEESAATTGAQPSQ